ncbi:MAG: LacI family DNA-binding transcriptional regulator [Oscillospiraceae bacterium]
MPKAVRMADIAARMGVSTVTVSKALSGKDGVSETLREKIRQTAVEIGYIKTFGGAKQVNRSGTGNIGIIIPYHFVEKQNSFYWDMYERVISRLMSNDYYGILEVLRQEDEGRNTPPRLLQEGKTDGVIVIGQLRPEYHRYLNSVSTAPIMFLDSYDSTNGNDSIISDGYYGMYAVTNHLLSQGHTDVYYVGTLGATSSISDRYYGFCRAMSEQNLPVTENMVIPDRDKEGFLALTLPERLPTAFVCNCDQTAYELILMLKAKGVRMPEDVSIVGFDNYMWSDISDPTITTYSVDMEGMARSCVDRLIRKIHNKSYLPSLKVVSGQVVVKDSVMPIARK